MAHRIRRSISIRGNLVLAVAVFSFAALCLTPPLPADDAKTDPEDVDLSQFYGFKPVELFKLEERSANMLAGDLNNDGRVDLAIVDNGNSRIDLLIQRDKQPEKSKDETTINSIKSDWRFKHEKLPVDRQVGALTLGDFNGDGRVDVCYFGAPDRLVVRFQPEEGDWTERTSYRLPDVAPAAWILAAGDLNSDDRADVALLGKNDTYIVYQNEDGLSDAPVKLMNTSEKLSLLAIADLDGDGRNDMCYSAADDPERSFCSRLQGDDGRMGAELRFELNRPRSLTLADVDGNAGREVLAIDSRTGRARVLGLKRPESKPGELAGRLIQYGFGRSGSGRDRDMAIADVDGDGSNDVVVTDPDAAQMLVFRQVKGRGLDLGTTFPGLLGATNVRAADFDGDKQSEVVVLSRKENTVGVSRFKGGRLTFPEPLPIAGEPQVLELADLDADGVPEVVYIARNDDGDSKYTLAALGWSKDGWKPHKFKDSENVPLKLDGSPSRLVRLDADGNMRPDFLVFQGLDRGAKLFLTDKDGLPAPVLERSAGVGLGDDVEAGAVFTVEGKEPALLVAEENFARRLTLGEDRQWKVVDQYNASESSARIVGAAVLNLDGNPGDEVVLVDTGIKRIRVLRKEENLYRPWREVEIGDFPYMSTRAADLDGDGNDDLLLFGRTGFGVLYAGRSDPTLQELASFESKLEKTYFADIVAGDLNGDGYADLAMIDTRSHYVEILNFDPKYGLRHALQFKVFEEKSFQAGAGVGSNPREAVVREVTGDKLQDLILLSHDRILVYPQDAGE